MRLAAFALLSVSLSCKATHHGSTLQSNEQTLDAAATDGPVLVRRGFFCQPASEDSDRGSDLVVRMERSDDSVQAVVVERLDHRDSCDVAANLLRSRCEGPEACSLIGCVPNDGRHPLTEQAFVHYSAAAGEGAPHPRRVFLARALSECSYLLSAMTERCPSLSGCDVRVCLAVDRNRDRLDSDLYRIRSTSDGGLSMARFDRFALQRDCLHATGAHAQNLPIRELDFEEQ